MLRVRLSYVIKVLLLLLLLLLNVINERLLSRRAGGDCSYCICVKTIHFSISSIIVFVTISLAL